MKKSLFIFLLLIAAGLRAQDASSTTPRPPRNTESFGDRIVTGGNFGLQFGSVTFIDISPMVGYKVTDRFVPGIGATYRYLNYHYYGYEQNAYGGSIFARYYVLDNLFAHAQYEVLNGEWNPFLPDYRYNMTSIFVGGGYRQMLGDRLATSILVLFNVNESEFSPYQNPIIRIGFGFGL